MAVSEGCSSESAGQEVTISQQTIVDSSSLVAQGQQQNPDHITPLQRIHLTPGFDPSTTHAH